MGARTRLTLTVQGETLTGKEVPGLRQTTASGHTTWELASPLDDAQEPAAHLAALLPIAEAAKPALRQLESAGGRAFWSCFVTAKPMGNMVWLEPQLLSRLADLGMPLVFDIYDSDPED
jgi:hypothetical protein